MLLERPFVCQKLAVSRWQSYNFFPAKRHGLICDTDVIHLLDATRKGIPDPCEFIPQLATAEQIQSETGASVHRLKLWARRKRNPVPHFRLNSHVLRFPVAAVRKWLEEA